MTLYLCTGTNVRYQARVRWYGHRRYRLVGKPSKSLKVAMLRMTKQFAEWKNCKRGDVVMLADYYEPVQLCEITR